MDDITYRVEVSRASTRKLAAHVAFLARVNNSAALRLHNEILADIRSLEISPSRYVRYHSQRFPDLILRQKLSAKRYLIIFTVHENQGLVTVVDIQDCRQDALKKLCLNGLTPVLHRVYSRPGQSRLRAAAARY